ncbi:hypothetical protein [Marinobacter adhaerens]|uniref:hypothetical protein n=1 Tax=Marinobacter adhaerens TaxID=1033846 RepID=UPI003BACDED4
MIDDLLRQIEEVIEEEGTNQDKRHQRGNIVVGNQSTVVIGDGNQIGRRESDRQKGEAGDTRCHGRRESDNALREELKQLRSQVKDLVQLITRLFLKNGSEGFKDDLPDSSARLNSNDKPPSKRADVSFCSRMAETPLVKPKRLATPRSVSHCPIQSHFIPDVSYLMAAHNPLNNEDQQRCDMVRALFLTNQGAP